jgi:hypothetical protein
MSDFIFLFRGGESVGSPEQMQKHMQKWQSWMQELGKKGNFKAGEPLEKGGKVVKGSRKAVTDGPFAEAKDLVGGFMLISASNLDEAVELSKGCPIFEHEGIVEVRPVMKMSM